MTDLHLWFGLKAKRAWRTIDPTWTQPPHPEKFFSQLLIPKKQMFLLFFIFCGKLKQPTILQKKKKMETLELLNSNLVTSKPLLHMSVIFLPATP